MAARGSFFLIATQSGEDLIYDRLEHAAQWARAHALQGAELFIGMNPREREAKGKDAVSVLTSCYVDLDLPEGESQEEALAEVAPVRQPRQLVCERALLLLPEDLGMADGGRGLGFAGLIPANVLAIRQLFPASEASWRIPTLLLASGTGMATGGWLGGVLYDHFGFYAPAFMAGVLANVLNFLLIGALILQQKRAVSRPALS